VVKKIIKDRPIKIALVGCGRISTKHFDAIKKYPHDLNLVAVCDSDTVALDKAIAQLNVPGYLNLDELLQQTDVDLVSLCTPSGLHAEQTIKVAQYGKNVITEKPMATKWSDGIRMVKACDHAGVRLFVVKQNRHNATLQLLKQAVQKRRFGKIYMVNVNVLWSRPQNYYDQAKWRGTWEFDGGALMNQASHYIDLLDWLIGPVANVHAMTGTLARNIEVEDTGVVNFRWRSGTLGSVSVTMLSYPQNIEGSITVLGEKGSVKIGGLAVNDIELWNFDDSQPEDNMIKDASYNTTSVYGFGHPAYYANVIKVLRGECEPETDGREGLKSLEILIAAYLSARDQKEIALPLEY
jgi:UDP-N-acetyl-2-amino-2-deoxyglucuronate dehydrogenase